MRSLQITAPGRCEIIETDRPRCGSDEVLIEMKACTICNQHDAAVFAGRAHGGPREYPLEPGFPGHEGAGVVVEVGEGVTDLAAGDRVVTTGIGGPPLYSEYVTRQATAAVKFPESVDFPAAAPLELFGCVHRAFTLTRSVHGVRVGVVGLGPAGQASVALARAFGAGEVVGFDIHGQRRDKALEMGAGSVVDAAGFSGAHEAVKRRLAGEAPSEEQRSALEAVREHQCEIVFECTGNPRSLEASFLLAGKDLTVFGYTDRPVEALPAVWFQKELTIRSSKILGIDDLRAVAGLLADGKIDTRPIVTDVVSFSDYPAALERIAAGEAIKIALAWER
jgi:threonine dehydrogenase-like Zn-dependent dehydrogenase